MKKIGLTGGIGSGKSYIAKIFETLDIPVFNADNISKEILNDIHNYSYLNNIFNEDIIYEDTQKPNRKRIAEIVFNEPDKLDKLNAFIHPKVNEKFEEWCNKYLQNSYVIKEAAILFESGSYKLLDAVINVSTPLELRIKRVMQRDKIDERAVLSRINNQMKDEEREQLSQYIIYNDDNTPVLAQVLKIHEQLMVS